MSQQIDACLPENKTRLQARENVLNFPSAASAPPGVGPLGENLVFLISQPRAGSTLLQRILAGHSDVFATAEPWIMLHPLHALKRTGYTADYNAEWARNALADFCETLPGGEDDYVQAVREMAVSLYNKALQASGKNHFVDKTPRYYCICPELRRAFPAAKFVFLVRNPIAILASIIQSWTKDEWAKMDQFRHDLLDAPGLLAAAIKEYGSDALVIRYEELAADPEGVVSRLCAELGLEFQPEMLDYGSHEQPHGSMGDHMGVNAHQQTVTSSVSKWRQTLASPEAKYLAFRYAAALNPETLSALGYPAETLLANVISIPGAPLGAGLSSDWLQWTNRFFENIQTPAEPPAAPAVSTPVPQPQRQVLELPRNQAAQAEPKARPSQTPSGDLLGIAKTFKEMADKRFARGDVTGARDLLNKAMQTAPSHPVLLAAVSALDAGPKPGESSPSKLSFAETSIAQGVAPFNAQPQKLNTSRPSRPELLQRYQAMFPRVEGWLMWEAIEILNFLNDAQMAEGVAGNFAEIGAYQGKLTLGMAAFLNPDKELLLVNDIFDHQDLNTSRSGIGATLAAFRRNLTDLDPNPHYLRIIMKRSDEVRPAELGSGIRFFSVDGGHSTEETRDDMRLAAQTIGDRGMIVLDDFFNTNWPGVEAGVRQYFERHADLAPLLAFYNKFVFVKRDSLAWFQQLLERHGFAAYCRAQEFKLIPRTLHGFDYQFVPMRPTPSKTTH